MLTMTDTRLHRYCFNPASLHDVLLRDPVGHVPVSEDGAPTGELTPASVLITLLPRPDGATVLLTRRTDHLRDHPGQISFPGGRAEPEDGSPVVTALREASEEVGLPIGEVEILGYLPEYRTGTGYRVTPVVALWAQPSPLAGLVLDAFEVAEVFEVPLAFLLNPQNHERHALTVRGTPRQYYAMPYGDYFIWGATAGMIVSLARQCGILQDPE